MTAEFNDHIEFVFHASTATVTPVSFDGFQNEGIKEVVESVLLVPRSDQLNAPLGKFTQVFFLSEPFLHCLRSNVARSPAGTALGPNPQHIITSAGISIGVHILFHLSGHRVRINVRIENYPAIPASQPNTKFIFAWHKKRSKHQKRVVLHIITSTFRIVDLTPSQSHKPLLILDMR